MDARPEFPYLFAVLELWFAERVCSGVLRRVRRSSSFLAPGPRKQPARTFLRSYRGTHPLGRSALSLLRCGERPRGYPDVASGRCAGPLRPWGRKRLLEVHVRKTRPHPHCAPARKGGVVRSDIRVPEAKRGRVPCRNEDDNRLSKRNRASPAKPSDPAFPSGNRGAKPSGPPPARTYPSRPAHPEEHAGRRHRSSPRRARVRRLHAHRWRLRG